MCAVLTRVGILIPARAVVVDLRIVRVGLLVRRNIGPVVPRIAIHLMTIRI